MNKLTLSVSTIIKAPISKVWVALTDPKQIKKYFFGVDTISDWKEGSSIIYRGSWEGKIFEDKGTIVKIQPEKLLHCTYWSSFSGLPDKPENYQKVNYDLTKEKEGIKLTITQDNIPTEESKKHSEHNWKTVFESMKKLLEK